jgi:hypothetical protein
MNRKKAQKSPKLISVNRERQKKRDQVSLGVTKTHAHTKVNRKHLFRSLGSACGEEKGAPGRKRERRARGKKTMYIAHNTTNHAMILTYIKKL